ncbi:hypothetical protein NDU88_000562 [Pleurodeles waltl]|uniref:Uncharacterized protein n=1 Tax=Pleurodeles waltl TaxID=8319 RepID=A0AAV7WLR0_PLEWA|nr:hypothetical protein NDU88_000562 [Pleurodeles waltl]
MRGSPDRSLPAQGEWREERVGQAGRCRRERPDLALKLSGEERRPGVKSGAEAQPFGSADRARPPRTGRPGEPEPTDPSSENCIKDWPGPTRGVPKKSERRGAPKKKCSLEGPQGPGRIGPGKEEAFSYPPPEKSRAQRVAWVGATGVRHWGNLGN